MPSRLVRRRRNPSRAFDCHHVGRASRLRAGGLLPDGGAPLVPQGSGPDGVAVGKREVQARRWRMIFISGWRPLGSRWQPSPQMLEQYTQQAAWETVAYT